MKLVKKNKIKLAKKDIWQNFTLVKDMENILV